MKHIGKRITRYEDDDYTHLPLEKVMADIAELAKDEPEEKPVSKMTFLCHGCETVVPISDFDSHTKNHRDKIK